MHFLKRFSLAAVWALALAGVATPVMARFLSVDPVPVDKTDGSNFNRYWYANNNPYKYVDPDGRNPIAGAAAGCAATGPACPAGAIVGAAIGTGVTIVGALVFNEIVSDAATPDIPSDLVGEQDSKSGPQGERHNSGPLSPERGGTGDAGKDFDSLTGGTSEPAPEGSRYPEGTKVGPNGIALRPGTDRAGPRIDIPARGDKPHETLHYPRGTE